MPQISLVRTHLVTIKARRIAVLARNKRVVRRLMISPAARRIPAPVRRLIKARRIAVVVRIVRRMNRVRIHQRMIVVLARNLVRRQRRRARPRRMTQRRMTGANSVCLAF